VISLERYDGAHSQRSASALGQRKPLHCTSQGKAILSAMEPQARDALVRELSLKPLTPHTITDRRRLQAELKITAARGWSIDDEEIVRGVRCVGAPVLDSAGRVRGAISVAGPAWRLTRERVELLGPEVAEAGRRIGAQLRPDVPGVGDPTVHAIEGPWAFHGAHPRWCTARKRLYWTDTLAPSLHVTEDDRDEELLAVEWPVTGLVLHGDDLLLTHERCALRVTPAGLHAPVTAWPAGRLLALCEGPQGTLWAVLEATGGGCAVGHIAPGGLFEETWQVDEPVHCLRWNAAGTQLYATAPGSGSLLILRPGSSGVRRLATLPKGSGRLSGLALDAHGGVWTALRDGWSVVRVSPDGALDRVIGLPVPCPTDVAIGGEHGDQLFITTARQPVALDVLANAPLSGRLLVTRI
jgi:IclR family acetate operon transcriptional repressor